MAQTAAVPVSPPGHSPHHSLFCRCNAARKKSTIPVIVALASQQQGEAAIDTKRDLSISLEWITNKDQLWMERK
jgi:hypothetical protein